MFNKLYTKSMSMIMILHFEDNFRGCKQFRMLHGPKYVNVKNSGHYVVNESCLRHFWGIYGQIVVDLYLMRYKHLRAKQ